MEAKAERYHSLTSLGFDVYLAFAAILSGRLRLDSWIGATLLSSSFRRTPRPVVTPSPVISARVYGSRFVGHRFRNPFTRSIRRSRGWALAWNLRGAVTCDGGLGWNHSRRGKPAL